MADTTFRNVLWPDCGREVRDGSQHTNSNRLDVDGRRARAGRRRVRELRRCAVATVRAPNARK